VAVPLLLTAPNPNPRLGLELPVRLSVGEEQGETLGVLVAETHTVREGERVPLRLKRIVVEVVRETERVTQ